MTDVESIMRAQKKRLGIMWMVDAVCAVLAIGALYGAMTQGVEWLWGVVIAAVAAGFGAQIWFIAGLSRAKKGV